MPKTSPTLLNTKDIAQTLGLSAHLCALYLQEAGPKPTQIKSFRKWGKTLEAKLYTPDEISKAHAQKWLKSHKERKKKKRSLKTGPKIERRKDHMLETLGLYGTPGAFAPSRPRHIVFHCGPTNSGKTHDAFEALRQCQKGIYAAPLRLLALEGYHALGSERTRLLTGEDNKGDDSRPLTSCTIEMLDLHQHYDVAVLDEIQMLADPERGWAWTHALLSVNADVIYICGSFEALNWVKAVLKHTKDTLDVRNFERKVPLEVLSAAVHHLEKGDALITFSRKEALSLRAALLAQGHKPALVYGAMPPEVRRHQAELFSNGTCDVLVATDAIGMGLNLPIRRVLFTTLHKYDGVSSRHLHPEEIRQIAGRAGRLGKFDCGYAGMYKTHPSVNMAMALPPPEPSRKRPRPMWRPMDNLSQNKPLYDALIERENLLTHPVAPFKPCFDKGLMWRAQIVPQNLPRNEHSKLLGAPVEPEHEDAAQFFLALCRALEKGQKLHLPKPPEKLNTRPDLFALEDWMRKATLARWADRHWPGRFFNSQQIHVLWDKANTLFSDSLAQDVLFHRTCSICEAPLPTHHRHGRCAPCHERTRNPW